MKNVVKRYIVIILLLLVSYGLGYYTTPVKVKTVVKIKKEIVINEKIKRVTVIKQATDGSKVTTITYKNDKVTNKNESKELTKVIVKLRPQWGISIGRYTSTKVQVSIDRRILGNLSVGYGIVLDRDFNIDKTNVYLRYMF